MSNDLDDDQFDDDELDHEHLLEQLVIGLLRQADLEDLCEQADLPVLLDAAGGPVTLTGVRGYRDAGVLTLDRGIWLEFSDGAVYGLTVSVSHRPAPPAQPGASTRTGGADTRRTPGRSSRRRRPRRARSHPAADGGIRPTQPARQPS